MRGAGILSLVIWLLVVVAPLPLLGAETSLGLHVVALAVLAPWWMLQVRGRDLPTPWLLTMATTLIFHTLVTIGTSPCRDMLARSIVSLLLMLGVGAALMLAAAASSRSQPLSIGRTLRAIALVVVASVVVDKIYLLLINASPFIRPSGIYQEPSHLALACAPVLAALVVSERGWDRWLGWVSAVLLMFLAASATLFVLFGACTLVALIAVSQKGRAMRLLGRFGMVVAAAIGLVMLSPFQEEFMARVSGLGTADAQSNVSSLIYLNGLQSAMANLEATDGLGLGFNRMGCTPRPVTDVTEILEAFELGDYNYNDGSFTAAKLLSELGVVGALWLLVCAGTLVSIMRRGRNERDPDCRQLIAFAAAALLVVTLGAFVRGTGYFSGPFLMGLFVFFLFRQPEARPFSA